MTKFKELLDHKGLKFTYERKKIEEEIKKIKGHFDADELYQRLKENGLRVSRDTVYRTLPLLLEAGVVQKSVGKTTREYFEKMPERGHHDHMISLKSNRIVEFHDEVLEKLQEEVCQKNDFEMVYHDHRLYGFFEDEDQDYEVSQLHLEDPKKDSFEILLNQKNLKYTYERRTIRDEALMVNKHFDADGFYQILKDKRHRISRDTVYRTLPLLLEAGVIQKSVGEGKKEFFEKLGMRGHHDHMVCLNTQRFIEFHSDAIEKRQLEVCEKYGFHLVYHDHRLYGYCQDTC